MTAVPTSPHFLPYVGAACAGPACVYERLDPSARHATNGPRSGTRQQYPYSVRNTMPSYPFETYATNGVVAPTNP